MIHRSHYRFEMILCIITLALVILWVPFYVALLLWMMALGTMQVIHSVILAVHYFQHQPVRNILIGYWIAVVIYLVALIQAASLSSQQFFFPILPLLMSLVPFLLTYFYKRGKTEPAPEFDFSRPGNIR